MVTDILLTLLFVMIGLACGLGLGRYVLPYRAPVEDWSSKRLWRELDAIRLELDMRGDPVGELMPADEDDWRDFPGDPDWHERGTELHNGPDDLFPDPQPPSSMADGGPEPASQPNNPPDGWQPAPGDRIAAWARTGPRLAIAAPAGVPSQPGQPRRANRFMDLVAQHLTEYDLHHMQRAAA